MSETAPDDATRPSVRDRALMGLLVLVLLAATAELIALVECWISG